MSPARRLSAGAGRAGETSAWRRAHRPLCSFFAFRPIFLLVNPQYLGRVRPKTAEFLVVGLVLIHPFDGLVVPLAGFFLVAELFVAHCQKEPVETVAALAEFHGFL